MAIKKTELYSSLWASCDELRGGMDASQYKDYVLTMLFMKYVSDKYKGDTYGMIDVPDGASFDDMVALKGDKEIGDGINKIIGKLAEANDLKGVIDVADFNDEDKLGQGKDQVDRLTNLVATFEGLNMGSNRADGDDLLGDAYEYLMRHFATESGKSKGQFYTPSEVSQVLAKVIGITADTSQDASVYDPTCGSGSLLLKASDQAPRGLSIFGQEMDVATAALAKMNMILHGHVSSIRTIHQGNTIATPAFKDENNQLKTFDFAVANPPFSNKNWTNGINPEEDEFGRFTWGIPPEKNGDYTFLLHILKSLKSTGQGAVILPHGVLFRGNAEARIRENLIKQGYIKGIIGLPANLFYGTGIPACIIVLDKLNACAVNLDLYLDSSAEDSTANKKIDNEKVKDASKVSEVTIAADIAEQGRSIFMIDASRGFMKDGNKNRLRSQDIHKMVDVFNKQLTISRYSRMIPFAEIMSNDYNLNIPRYIDSSEPEDIHDLSAHLQGGIPNRDIDALDAYWQVFPSIRASLFSDERAGYSQSLVASNQVKNTILNHNEFQAFAEQSLTPFNNWSARAALTALSQDEPPKAVIHRISEDLLASYADSRLLSKYDIYQILMDYWASIMQDDVYILVQDGWQAGNSLRKLVNKKGQKLNETPDLVINKVKYKATLIAPELIIQRYFAIEQTDIDSLQAELDNGTQALDSYIEEHSDEDGLLTEALNDKDKITKASIANRIKLNIDAAERQALKHTQALYDAENKAKKALKDAQDALDIKVFMKYPTLSEEDIKTLVVEDKWLATLRTQIIAEIERITQRMTVRVQELDERYAEPLPAITQSVTALSRTVAEHLRAMGLEVTLV